MLDFLYTKDAVAVMPVGALAIVALTMVSLDLFKGKVPVLFWTLTGCAVAVICSLPSIHMEETAVKGLVHLDAFTFFFNAVIVLGLGLTALLNHRMLSAQGVDHSVDIDVLIILATIGAMVMISAANLMVLFLGFEMLSIAVYVLAGLAQKERISSEAALKYFILGAFSSAFLLYGMVLVYGATGTMFIPEIAASLVDGSAAEQSVLLRVGIGLMIFGFGFKVGAVPFHFWTPDVYQGAPVSITTYMAAVVKAAAFGSFLRVMVAALGSVGEAWIGLIWVISVITMTVGNLVALRQTSMKRMLAYSSIAHAGYALIGFVALDNGGGGATAFYLLVYTLMTVASFGVVVVLTSGTSNQYSNDSYDTYQGLGWKRPFLGLVMTVALLSLAGMPPLGGFVGKLYLFKSAISEGFVGLAIIGALNSVVSLYYYLRVVVLMYFTEEDSEIVLGASSFSSSVALVLATVGTLVLGLFSEPFLGLAQEAIRSITV